MSTPNPYALASSPSSRDDGIRKVRVRTLGLMKRAYRLVGNQYWMFVGVTLVGTIVASAVPFGLVAGAMAVGICLCYIQRERGGQVEFHTLFRGFDFFMESLIAFLVYFIASVLVMIPFMIAIFVMVIGPMIAAAGNAGNALLGDPAGTLKAILVLYPLMIFAHVLVALPFFFTFQLIADRNLRALDAVARTSAARRCQESGRRDLVCDRHRGDHFDRQHDVFSAGHPVAADPVSARSSCSTETSSAMPDKCFEG